MANSMKIGCFVVVVLGIAIAVRLVFILAFPSSGGDWDIYSTVAENILRGCGVSLSPPDRGQCVPHFGGNHLPGYPAFVAVIWLAPGIRTWQSALRRFRYTLQRSVV